jgi:hypothetical protein
VMTDPQKNLFPLHGLAHRRASYHRAWWPRFQQTYRGYIAAF